MRSDDTPAGLHCNRQQSYGGGAFPFPVQLILRAMKNPAEHSASSDCATAEQRTPTAARAEGPPLDFQAHLAALEARGLLLRIDRPINKDTELHPLVRWQFQGGLREDQRRAFLFTNVVDTRGRSYGVPVAVGALAASPQIYSVGMGRPVEEIEAAWLEAIAHPIPPILVSTPSCQPIVLTGDSLRGAENGLVRLPVPISTPGFDAAPYLTATLCVTRDPDTGVQNMGTYRAALKAPDRLGGRMASRSGGAGGTRGNAASNREGRYSRPCRSGRCGDRDRRTDRAGSARAGGAVR